MDSVKNWCRSKSMTFQQKDFGMSCPSDFKSQSYGPTDRAMKSAAEVCKKLTPSNETKNSVINTVEHYGRKLIPNEATKQKVSRFYESQVAKLKYAQLKDGYQPSYRDDLTRFNEDESFYGSDHQHSHKNLDRQVPTTVDSLSSPTRSRARSFGSNAGHDDWNGTFMQFKEPIRRT